MSKKSDLKAKQQANAAAEEADTVEQGTAETDQTPFVAQQNTHNGGWHYFDQAGRIYKGYQTEENAQAAADAHVPIENDPTLDAE